MGKILIRNLSSVFIVLMLAFTLGMLAGCEGDDGAAGLSAYEIAVNNGFVGTEAEWVASLEAAVPDTEESCNVCHGVTGWDGIEINVVHPPPREKPIVSNIVVARSAGDVLTVTFSVRDAAGDPVEGIGLVAPSSGSDLRVYMADIVPAGTATVNLPQSTWPQDYLELWAEERGNDAGVVIAEPAPGDYSFTMVATPAAIGGPNAPEGDLTHTQRVYVRADARDFGVYNRTIGVADFIMPAAGADTGILDNGDTIRTIVDASACTACHGDPLERASHGGGYQSPQVCNLCHSPIGSFDEGGVLIGDGMQESGFWLASLIHGIHTATLVGTWPGETPADFTEVTYPKNIKDCGACHFDAGQDLADSWKDNVTIEGCTTCHDVTFGAAATHSGGTQNNSGCVICHPADGNGFGQSVSVAHEVTTLKTDPSGAGGDISLTPNYTASITLSDDANADGVYEAGEAILVTVTASNAAAGDYTNPAGPYTIANLYVYGPRNTHPLPVLTTGSTTDPAYDPAVDGAPDQGRSMLISAAATDAQVLTDDAGFKYQLFAIPADLEPGTYMVMTYVTALADCTGVYRGNTCIDGWALTTFQVGTATPDEKIAGECTNCHDQSDWGSMFHRSYFGTDGCNACHDQSGNYAKPITNRVHAVHSASEFGDLGSIQPPDANPRDWSEITFPRNILSCEACHNSGSVHYNTLPHTWGAPCLGCHGDTDGIRGHMEQNGSDFD
jgi:hypothetical protein